MTSVKEALLSVSFVYPSSYLESDELRQRPKSPTWVGSSFLPSPKWIGGRVPPGTVPTLALIQTPGQTTSTGATIYRKRSKVSLQHFEWFLLFGLLSAVEWTLPSLFYSKEEKREGGDRHNILALIEVFEGIVIVLERSWGPLLLSSQELRDVRVNLHDGLWECFSKGVCVCVCVCVKRRVVRPIGCALFSPGGWCPGRRKVEKWCGGVLKCRNESRERWTRTSTNAVTRYDELHNSRWIYVTGKLVPGSCCALMSGRYCSQNAPTILWTTYHYRRLRSSREVMF